MARNIEIKARIDDAGEALRVISGIARIAAELQQEDTFFSCDHGRLKLREETGANDTNELIFYARENIPGPRPSQYLRYPVTNPTQLREVLAASMGIIGRVNKKRTLFWIGNARIHLDEVVGLAGGYLEIEVVLDEEYSLEDGMATMSALMERLQIDSSQLVADAYVDLLAIQPMTAT